MQVDQVHTVCSLIIYHSLNNLCIGSFLLKYIWFLRVFSMGDHLHLNDYSHHIEKIPDKAVQGSFPTRHPAKFRNSFIKHERTITYPFGLIIIIIELWHPPAVYYTVPTRHPDKFCNSFADHEHATTVPCNPSIELWNPSAVYCTINTLLNKRAY